MLGAEVKPWAFLSEQKRGARGPEDPMSLSLSIGMHQCTAVQPERDPRLFPEEHVSTEFPLRGGTLPVSFDR